MPGNQDVIQLFPGFPGEKETVLLGLKEIKEELKTLSGFALFSKTTSGAAEFKAQAQQLTEALARIKALETDLENIRTKNHGSQKARTDEEIRESVKSRQETTQRVQAIKAEGDAYKQLVIQYKQAEQAAKALAAQYGVHSTQAKEAVLRSKELGEQLSNINKATGNNSPLTGVGRYAEGIKEFAKEALLATAAFIGLNSVVHFFEKSADAASEAEAATTRFNLALQNAGRLDALDRLNEKVELTAQKFKLFHPDEIKNVFAAYVNYGKLTENQLDKIIPLTIDFYSQQKLAGNQTITLAEAGSVLIKAMEGNARALKEYGINVKEGNNFTERFSILMRDLKPRIEGSAEAFEKTFGGAVKETQTGIHELQEDIGKNFMPFLKGIYQGIDGLILGAKKFVDIIRWSFLSTEEKKEELAKNAREAAVKDARENAASFLKIEDFASKTKSEQAEKLHTYEVQAEFQRQKLIQAIKTGNASDKATYELLFQRSKQILAQASTIYRDGNKVLGVGEKPKVGTGDDNESKLKEIEDYSEKFKEILDRVYEYNQRAFNIDVKPLERDLNNAFIEYNKFFVDIVSLRDKDQAALKKHLEAGEIEQKQYSDISLEINRKADQDLTALELAYQNNTRAIKEKYRKEEEEKARQHDEKMFADHKKFESEVTKELQEHAKAEKEIRDAKLQAERDLVDTIVQYAQKGEQLIAGLLENSITRKKNALQAQEDDQQKNYEREVKRISSLTGNDEQRAAQLKILESQRQIQKEQNERKNRQLEQERARFEKAAAIVKIIENTAVAITNAITTGDPYTAALRATIVGAIASAELAVAIAAPIPHYLRGTGHSAEGWALTDEKGAEGYIPPSGKPFLGNDRPTLRFLEKGTKIIPHDEVNKMLLQQIFKGTVSSIEKDNGKDIRELKEAILMGSQAQVNAIKKQRAPAIHFHNDAGFLAHINASVRD